MALTPSNMLPLGTKAPDFELPDTISDKKLSLSNLKSDKATVVMFICNHCPYVVHVQDEIMSVSNDYLSKGVSFIAISSNDIENYPQDAPDKMKILAQQLNYKFPYLYDETQEVAKAYDAACTPDFYVFDKEMKLVYRGELDGSRPGNDVPLSGVALRQALDSVLANEPVNTDQRPSMGCNIKWKS
ncbi:thioredoxin family protein [Fulvivirgaceae bacterium BMA10]|uniref:Thioredoxin family protein n=1 Tax=Splendidivirga corallicola TaxID=3051826 RepID=A0ABT8KKK3_9BACT|nr:thioredoxin family protein [Fulvivirgaceae bacterium BMA10]